MYGTLSSIVLNDRAETVIQRVKLPRVKPHGVLWLQCFVAVLLDSKTSLHVRLYRGNDVTGTCLSTCRADAPSTARRQGVVSFEALDYNPAHDGQYTVTATKTGRGRVDCTPLSPRWQVV